LHGFIEKRTGSCSSLPVLMVAIGRRCGYPLFLVTCKGHLFCRWDDGKERFNIETACPGVDSKPDSYYMHWPHPTNPAEAKAEKFLKSLNHTEELAVFARLRATCLEENKRYAEASEAYSFALPSFPESKYLKAYLNNVNRRK
jgi:regulator of sirC expression with transglutaminase-like and TPR domain